MRTFEQRALMERPTLAPSRVAAIVEAWEERRRNRPRAVAIEIKIHVTARNGSDIRAASTQRMIERCCLGAHRPKVLSADRSRLNISLAPNDSTPLDARMRQLVASMHALAAVRGCEVELMARHRDSGQLWS